MPLIPGRETGEGQPGLQAGEFQDRTQSYRQTLSRTPPPKEKRQKDEKEKLHLETEAAGRCGCSLGSYYAGTGAGRQTQYLIKGLITHLPTSVARLKEVMLGMDSWPNE